MMNASAEKRRQATADPRAGQRNVRGLIHQASDMSMTRTTRIDDDLAANKIGDIQREVLERSMSGGVDWTAKEMLAERDAQVKRMQEEIEALRNGHNSKESELKQLRKWH